MYGVSLPPRAGAGPRAPLRCPRGRGAGAAPLLRPGQRHGFESRCGGRRRRGSPVRTGRTGRWQTLPPASIKGNGGVESGLPPPPPPVPMYVRQSRPAGSRGPSRTPHLLEMNRTALRVCVLLLAGLGRAAGGQEHDHDENAPHSAEKGERERPGCTALAVGCAVRGAPRQTDSLLPPPLPRWGLWGLGCTGQCHARGSPVPASGYPDVRSDARFWGCRLAGTWGCSAPRYGAPRPPAPPRTPLPLSRSRQLLTPAGSVSPPRAQPRAPLPSDASHRTAPHRTGARGSRPPAGSVQRSRCGAAPRRAVGWRERGKRGAGCCCVPPPTPRRELLSFGVILGEIMLSPCGLGPFSHPGIQQGLGDGAVCCSPAAEHSAGMSPSHLCFAHGFAFPGSQCAFTFPCVKYRLLQTAAVTAVIHISY